MSCPQHREYKEVFNDARVESRSSEIVDLTCDDVYFLGASSPASFAGHLHTHLDEEEIEEYIFRTNYKLYARLWQPCSESMSSDVDSTDKRVSPIVSRMSYLDAASDLEDTPIPRLAMSAGPKSTSSSDLVLPSISSSPGREHLSSCTGTEEGTSNLFIRTSSRTTPTSPFSSTSARAEEAKNGIMPLSPGQRQLKQDLYLLQTKRYIQSFLCNNHVLILQKVPPLEAGVKSYRCGHPLCEHSKRAMPPGTYLLSLEVRQNLMSDFPPGESYRSRPNEDAGKYIGVKSTKSRGYYCLMCLEALFNGVGMIEESFLSPVASHSDVTPAKDSTPVTIALDGCSDVSQVDRAAVLSAAEALQVRPFSDGLHTPVVVSMTSEKDEENGDSTSGARVSEAAMENSDDLNQLVRSESAKTPPPPSPRTLATKALNSTVETAKKAEFDESFKKLLPLNFPSNSDFAIHVRNERRKAINSTHQYLARIAHKFETRESATRRLSSALPSLSLVPPPDLPTGLDRYKKQGLTSYDQRTSSKSAKMQASESRKEDVDIAVATLQSKTVLEALARSEIYCYCLEPDDHAGMVQCCAEFCQIGWVHLKCSGLPRVPENEETWYCKYCSSIFGPGTFDTSRPLVLQDEEREPTPELDSIVDTASDQPEEPTPDSDASVTHQRHFLSSEGEDADAEMPTTPPPALALPNMVTHTPYAFLDGGTQNMTESSDSPLQIQVAAETNIMEAPRTSPKKTPSSRRRTSFLDAGGSPLLGTPIRSTRRRSSVLQHTPPPSRRSKSTFNHLAAFIYAETRESAAALSIPHVVAIERWKTALMHSNLKIAEKGEKATQPVQGKPSPPKRIRISQAVDVLEPRVPDVAVMEIGEAVIDLPNTSILGKKLSQVLAEVGRRVELGLRQHEHVGWEQGMEGREDAVRAGKAKGNGGRKTYPRARMS